MEADLKSKIADVLQGKTLQDVLFSEEFENNATAYLNSQRADRKKYLQQAARAKAKVRVQKHTIDRVDYLTGGNFAKYYFEVINGISKLSAAERLYIEQLGRQIYNKTIQDWTVAKYPETEGEFYKKQGDE